MDCWSTCSIDVAESQTPVAATLVDDKKKKKKKTKTKKKKKRGHSAPPALERPNAEVVDEDGDGATMPPQTSRTGEFKDSDGVMSPETPAAREIDDRSLSPRGEWAQLKRTPSMIRQASIGERPTLTRRVSLSAVSASPMSYALGMEAVPGRYVLKHVTIFCGVAITLAAILHVVELPKEERDRQDRKDVIDRMREIFTSLYSEVGTTSDAGELLTELSDVLSESCDPRPGYVFWSIPGSIYFVATVVTTIGYGTFAPLTTIGKAVTVFTSLFGVAYFGFILSLTARAMKSGIQRFSILWTRVRGQPPPTNLDKGITLKVFFWTLAYVFFVACLGAYIEGVMTFGNALYFAVITFTTVGLGDFAPPFVSGSGDNVGGHEVTTFYALGTVTTIVGLALLSALVGAANDEFFFSQDEDSPEDGHKEHWRHHGSLHHIALASKGGSPELPRVDSRRRGTTEVAERRPRLEIGRGPRSVMEDTP